MTSGSFLRVPPVALKMQPHNMVLGFSNELSTCLTIFKLVNVLSRTQQYGTLQCTCHLCSKFYLQVVISTVKSRQISNIHTQGFLLKCKKTFNFTNGPIKISKNDKKH